jgi:signal peptidase
LLIGQANGDEAPNFLGYRQLSVTTGSMEPAISPGDGVIVRTVPIADLAVGDVITFYEKSSFVTHRIVAIDGEGKNARFTTRGDANNTNDNKPVSPDRILGRLVFTFRGGAKMLEVLSSPLGVMIICLLPVGIVFGRKYFRKWRQKRGDNGAVEPVKPRRRHSHRPIFITRKVYVEVEPEKPDNELLVDNALTAGFLLGILHEARESSKYRVVIDENTPVKLLPVLRSFGYKRGMEAFIELPNGRELEIATLSNNRHAIKSMVFATAIALELGIGAKTSKTASRTMSHRKYLL